MRTNLPVPFPPPPQTHRFFSNGIYKPLTSTASAPTLTNVLFHGQLVLNHTSEAAQCEDHVFASTVVTVEELWHNDAVWPTWR